MLRTNLATRPFYNIRAVRAVLDHEMAADAACLGHQAITSCGVSTAKSRKQLEQ